MFHKSILGGLAVAAVTAAVVVAKVIRDRKNEVEEEEDNEIHFIEINDEEEEEEEESEEEPQPHSIEIDDENEEPDSLEVPNFGKSKDDEKEEVWETAEEPVAVSDEVKEIMDLYPYLSAKFIEDLLSKDSTFNEEFPENTLVKATHHVTFKDEETLNQFKEIMEGQYTLEDDNGGLSANKRFFSEPGAIISEILNVANQTNALPGGKYVSYDLD